MEEHERGREAFKSEEAYRIHCLRHSTAHVMAQAIQTLFPQVRLAIGPAIADGFYYDIDMGRAVHETDLEAIEAEMKRIVKENQNFEHEDWSATQALEYFQARDQIFKLELIEGFGDAQISIYRNRTKDGGEFVDLCKGPHVLRTGQCKHFKLLKVSGAYWRGDATKQQLQRIYGTVWPTKDELEKYLYQIEEAKKRDHRKIGKDLELFMFHDWAPGAPFWLPRGEDLYHNLSERVRGLLTSKGYVAVKTPLIFDKKLWETSGHWEHYLGNMFHFPEGHFDHEHSNDKEEPERILALKAMNCPSHMLIFKSKKHSYRDLPIRMHDQGVLHRNELSGALSGLTRVRQFSQDDAHIFCTEDQITGEVGRVLDLVQQIYTAFDMGYQIALSTRPPDKLGDDALWDQAEGALKDALESRQIVYKINAGDGAFYGPKIDFEVLDALGRPFQCATLQLDFQLPRRFELSYVGADNTLHTPVVIHRAILGSFERFIGVLIEHYAGNFPTWLCPEQVRVLTVSEKSVEHGRAVHRALQQAGIKSTLDDGDEKIGYKIRLASGFKIPYLIVIGEKEQEEGSVSVRARGGVDLGSSLVSDFIEKLKSEIQPPF